MTGEWNGWHKWAEFKDAGIVEDSVDFSDEPIIVDHAVGRTKKAIGKCWPIDAAVAYTLMKAGPDNPLKWADMINTYTKMASVMMTRKVAYGEVPRPDISSCGHDEVTATQYFIGKPHWNKTARGIVSLGFKTNWGGSKWSDWFTQLEEDKTYKGPKITEELKALTAFRIDTINKDKLGNGHGLVFKHFLLTKHFAPLKEWLIKYIEHEQKMKIKCIESQGSVHQTTISKQVNHTRGVCKWKDKDKKQCAHHDNPQVTMWAMVRNGDGFRTIYQRQQCTTYSNHNQFGHIHNTLSAKNIVSWEEMRRSMADSIPDADVIMEIRGALSRMLKRNDNIVSKSGRGKNSLHYWSDWGWLAEMTAYVKNTSSKNRIAGEVQKGWVYSKINSRHSYGHEIAEFIWKPQEELKDYIVGRKEPDASSWQGANGVMTNYRFATKEAVKEFMAQIAELHSELGGHYQSRTHDGIEKIEKGEWSIRSVPISMSMFGRVDPEDYITPQEAITLFRNASKEVLEDHMENFHDKPNYNVYTAVAKSDE
tara:strand:- start:403 stop:2007 length:1605 start_codon:yes stop_codon:yes gene_type:complete